MEVVWDVYCVAWVGLSMDRRKMDLLDYRERLISQLAGQSRRRWSYGIITGAYSVSELRKDSLHMLGVRLLSLRKAALVGLVLWWERAPR